MKNLNAGLLTASMLFGCTEKEEIKNDESVKSVCEQVHEAVETMHFRTPEEGKKIADIDRKKCEGLPPEEQKQMLQDSRTVQGVLNVRERMILR